MAFNWQTFRTRTISAIIFAAIMLTGLLWNQWSFLVLFSVIHFGCWWEYLKLTEKIHNTSFHVYTKLGLMVMGYGLMLWFCGSGYQIEGYGFKENLSLPVSAVGFALLLIGIFQKNAISLKEFGMALLGLLYISLSWGLMMELRSLELYYVEIKETFYDRSWKYPVMIIASLWINDTMAYILGSLIGKRSLSRISPKKTWEGTIGGIVLTIGVMFLVYFFSHRELFSGSPSLSHSAFYWYKDWVFIPLIASVVGTIGDLLESKLKRMAGVKDSGTLLPGHGGFLDRFDSLLLATPFTWLYVMLFIK
ncbi:MAG: phosphatidate cytidylyltransferase [Bacteroidota bacterium]